MDKVIDGVTYTYAPESTGCKGCVAEQRGPETAFLCVELGKDCFEHPIVWIKKV